MAGVKNIKKTAKSRAKPKKESVIMPKLRLEPWLTPKLLIKEENIDAEDSVRSLKSNEINDNSPLAILPHDVEMRNDFEQESEVSNVLNNDSSSAENMNFEVSEDAQSSDYETESDDDDDDWGKPVAKKQKKPSLKVKAFGRKRSKIVSRISSETRFRLKTSRKNENKQVKETENNSRFSRTGENGDNYQFLSPDDEFSYEMRNECEQESEVSHVSNNNHSVSIGKKNCKMPEENSRLSDDDNDECWENITIRKTKKSNYRKNCYWNDRELMDLAIGLQTEGFSDLKKVADEYIKTKNENDIETYMKRYNLEARKAGDSSKHRGRPSNKWFTMCPKDIATWPTTRKWKKMAYNQMLALSRTKDYSRPVIASLCQRFFEEEEEPTDPQVINVKLIYKYIMDCMSGDIPAQLPPKESALVLDLLREVRLMPIAYDFEEELKFLHDFKEATKFKPFEVKDEFKKRFKKANDDVLGPNTVSVPEEVFLELSRHKKLVQSFNPLVTPVWMLQKEQEVLEKYAEESNVYVD